MSNPIVPDGVLLGRARVPGSSHPHIVTVRDGQVIDITSKAAPTSRDVAEQADPAGYVKAAKGHAIGPVQALLDNSFGGKIDASNPYPIIHHAKVVPFNVNAASQPHACTYWPP